ncbi:MAG: hypothetical protein NT062_33840 [Proteobacteria bacterium]|nr:hypothetical protein [Pseudomonadota bacterium]
MSLGSLAIGYVGLGALLAITCALVTRPPVADTLLVVVLWPLYAPFLLAGARARDPREAELLDALARAATSPLGAMLPDRDNARVLAQRLREAGTRLVDLETVLARPDFDPSPSATPTSSPRAARPRPPRPHSCASARSSSSARFASATTTSSTRSRS